VALRLKGTRARFLFWECFMEISKKMYLHKSTLPLSLYKLEHPRYEKIIFVPFCRLCFVVLRSTKKNQ
jgi:hypothetical protein